MIGIIALATSISAVASTLGSLRLPDPGGSFVTGKIDAILTDDARPEPATADGDDRRRVRVVAWYPAEAGTGRPAEYVSDLGGIAGALVASGELGEFEVAGLSMVSDPARADGTMATTEDQYPIIVFSPGNATNVEFYGALAEELASHGFVVIGIDHPYQVAAVDLDGDVAIYGGDPPLAEAEDFVQARIDERVADIGFVLDRLERDAAGLEALAGHLDLARIGVMGHSNGGIAAAQACADARVDACVNLDGQLAGGPLSSRAELVAPTKPFMFVTKEVELHPDLATLFEQGGRGFYRVIIPAASHDHFADGPMFVPRLLPIPGTAEHVIAMARGFTLAFFDSELRGASASAFETVNAPTDVQVFVYPLVAAERRVLD